MDTVINSSKSGIINQIKCKPDLNHIIRSKYLIKNRASWLPILIFRKLGFERHFPKILHNTTQFFFDLNLKFVISTSKPLELSPAISSFPGKGITIIHYQNIQNILEGLKKYYQLSSISGSPVPGIKPVFRVSTSKSSPGISTSRPVELSPPISSFPGKGITNIYYHNTPNVLYGLKKYYQLSSISGSPVPGLTSVFLVSSSKSSPGISASRSVELITPFFLPGKGITNIHYHNTPNVLYGLKKYYQLSSISGSPVPGLTSVFRVVSSKSSPDISTSRPLELSPPISSFSGKGITNIHYHNIQNILEGLRKYYQLSSISGSPVPGITPVFRVVSSKSSPDISTSRPLELSPPTSSFSGKGITDIHYHNTPNVLEGLRKYYQLSSISGTPVPGITPVFLVSTSKSSPGISTSRPVEPSLTILFPGKGITSIHYQNTKNVLEGLKKYYQSSSILGSPIPGITPVFRVISSKSSPGISASRPVELSPAISFPEKGITNIHYHNTSNVLDGLTKYNQLSLISGSPMPGITPVFRVSTSKSSPGISTSRPVEPSPTILFPGKGITSIHYHNTPNVLYGLRKYNQLSSISGSSVPGITPVFRVVSSKSSPGISASRPVELITPTSSFPGKGITNIHYNNTPNVLEGLKKYNQLSSISGSSVPRITPVFRVSTSKSSSGISTSRPVELSPAISFPVKGITNIHYHNIQNVLEGLKKYNQLSSISGSSVSVITPLFHVVSSKSSPGISTSRPVELSPPTSSFPGKGITNIHYHNTPNVLYGLKKYYQFSSISGTPVSGITSVFRVSSSKSSPGISASRPEELSTPFFLPGKGITNIHYHNTLNVLDGLKKYNQHSSIMSSPVPGITPVFRVAPSKSSPGISTSRPVEPSTLISFPGKGIWNIISNRIINYETFLYEKRKNILTNPILGYEDRNITYKNKNYTPFENKGRYAKPEILFNDLTLSKSPKSDKVEPEKNISQPDKEMIPVKERYSPNNSQNEDQGREIEMIAEKVYSLIEKKIEIEKDRRGLF